MILGVRASGVRAHGYTGASCLHERRGRPVAGAGVSPLGSALKGWGSWSLTCSLFSYQNKLSLARKLSVGSEHAGLVDGMILYRQNVLFVCGYSQVILLCYALNLLK